jgi:ribosome-associated protein
MLLAAAAACEDKKGEDTRILELDPVDSGLADYFLITSATNDRQVLAISDEIELRLKRDFGVYAASVEGRRQAEWILLDYVDIVIHVFLAEKRHFYDIERLRKSARPLTPANVEADLEAELRSALAEKTRAVRKRAARTSSPSRKPSGRAVQAGLHNASAASPSISEARISPQGDSNVTAKARKAGIGAAKKVAKKAAKSAAGKPAKRQPTAPSAVALDSTLAAPVQPPIQAVPPVPPPQVPVPVTLPPPPPGGAQPPIIRAESSALAVGAASSESAGAQPPIVRSRLRASANTTAIPVGTQDSGQAQGSSTVSLAAAADAALAKKAARKATKTAARKK